MLSLFLTNTVFLRIYSTMSTCYNKNTPVVRIYKMKVLFFNSRTLSKVWSSDSFISENTANFTDKS